ncbi:MAG: translocation/assembly module TamB domain-containing protein [Usitatibacter sp.]
MSAEDPIIDAPPPKGTRARIRWVRHVLALLGVLLLVIVLGISWVLYTQGGAQFVLGRVVKLAGDGIRYEGVEGSLGGPMRIKLIEVSRPDMYARIEDFEMDSSLFGVLRGRLQVNRLHAGKVEVRTADSGAAAKLPVSFAPPYAVRLERGTIGELRLGALTRAMQAEKDSVKRRAMMVAANATDLVIKEILLRGEGDERHWKIDEARAGTIYGNGRVAGTLATRAPFTLDANADFEGIAAERPYKARVTAKGTLQKIEAQLAGEVSGQPATGRVLIEPFAPVPVRSLEVTARGVDLSQQASGPKTKLDVDVRLAASQKTFSGPLKVTNAEPGPWDKERLPFTVASAKILISPERVDLTDLDVMLEGGGRATGRATLRKSGVQAELRVADVNLAALHGQLQKTRMSGSIKADGDKEAQRFEIALKDPRFEVEGKAGIAAKRLEVQSARVRTGGGSVTATGNMALEGRKEFRFEGRAQHFDPSAFVKTTKGDLNFAFVVRGDLADGPAGEAKLDISTSSYAGLPTSGRVNVSGDRRRVAAADVDVLIGGARLTATGAFGRAGDAMDITFRVPNLAVLAKPFGVRAAGKVEGDARLTGTFALPAGRVAFTGANLVLPANVYVKEVAARVEAGVDPDSSIDVTVQAKGVAIGAETPPTPLAETLNASIKGTRSAHRFEMTAKMNRDNEVKLALQGGLDARAKAPAWNGRIENFAMTGRGAFAMTAPASLSASATRVELGEAALKGSWGDVRLMLLRWTPRTLDVKATTPGVQIQNLARSLRIEGVPRSNLVLAGDIDIHAAETFEGTVNLRRVSGDLRVGEPVLALGLKELTLKAEAVRGRATASLLIAGDRVGRIQGDGSGLIVRGDNGWTFGANSPVEARIVAEHTNIESLAAWLGPEARLGGKLSANIEVSGTGANPQVAGTLRAENLAVREPATGFEIEKGLVALRMKGKSVVIEQFTATAPWRPSQGARDRIRGLTAPDGGGKITAEGALDLGERKGAIRIKLDQVPVTQLETRFLALSGEATLAANMDGVLAAGTFKADAGWVGALATALPSVSDDVIVVRASAPKVTEAEAKREQIRLDVTLGLGDRFYFQGRGLDTRLTGEIKITGTPGPGLRAGGIIRTVGGTFDGYGQKLSIERGVLSFNGPIDNPQLNVLALRKGLPVEAGVEVLGTTTRPRIRLVSNPDVPEPEKLSWLVLGRGASDASLGDSAVMMAAARALLGNNGSGGDLTKKLGFDEFRIGRADTNSILGVLPQSTVAGRTGTSSASDVVSIGRRISNSVQLTYEQGLADAEGALKITWRISRQFQLLARAGYLPGVDAVYRWTFE